MREACANEGGTGDVDCFCGDGREGECGFSVGDTKDVVGLAEEAADSTEKGGCGGTGGGEEGVGCGDCGEGVAAIRAESSVIIVDTNAFTSCGE